MVDDANTVEEASDTTVEARDVLLVAMKDMEQALKESLDILKKAQQMRMEELTQKSSLPKLGKSDE